MRRAAGGRRMNDEGSDYSECIAGVLRGDQDAARELVGRLHPFVLRLVRARLPRRQSEEDMVQEVLMKVFASLSCYRGVAPFEHWVSRVAVNACLNQLRGERSRPELRFADLTEDQAALLESGPELEADDPSRAQAARELVDRLLQTLPATDAALLRWLELEELSVLQVRELTGWSATYIRVRAFRARRLLNRRFGDLWRQGRL